MKMKLRTLRELLLYNYRYWFGYAMIGGFIAYFLGWKINSYPRGLSQYELSAAAGNASLADIATSPLYPLHAALQWISIQLLDVSVLSLRLPGLIIGLLTALVLYQLLRRWFGKPAALMSTALFVSADWFLFIARLGTGAIEFSLWLTLALLCLTKLLEKKTQWVIPLTASLCFLLFAPFGIYAVATIVITVFASRIFKTRVLEAGRPEKITAGIIAGLSVALFVATSVQSLDFLKASLGLVSVPSLQQYFINTLNNLAGVVVVLPTSNPLLGPSDIFFVRFFELIFIALGLIMLWRTRVNKLNLLVLTLGLVFAVVSGLSAGSRGNGLILIPAAICMAAGVRHFLHRWQRTFPKNPYARMAAYIPIAVLILCTVALHYTSYFVLWQSQPAARSEFKRDLELITTELSDSRYTGKTCFVESDDVSINTLITVSNPTCATQFDNQSGADYVIKRPNSQDSIPEQQSRPLTSELSNDNIRWIVTENQ